MSLGPEEAELKALQTAFTAVWDAIKATYPFVLGDTPFKGEALKTWVRLAILPGKGDRQDLGSSSPRHVFPGTIVVQCYVSTQATKSPDWIAADLTQKVRPIYEDKQFVTDTNGHIVCDTTYHIRVSKLISDKTGWLRYDIITPYTRYEV